MQIPDDQRWLGSWQVCPHSTFCHWSLTARVYVHITTPQVVVAFEVKNYYCWDDFNRWIISINHTVHGNIHQIGKQLVGQQDATIWSVICVGLRASRWCYTILSANYAASMRKSPQYSQKNMTPEAWSIPVQKCGLWLYLGFHMSLRTNRNYRNCYTLNLSWISQFNKSLHT